MNVTIWKFQGNDLVFIEHYLFYKIDDLVHVFDNNTRQYSVLEDYDAFFDHMINVYQIKHQRIVERMAHHLLSKVYTIQNDTLEYYNEEEIPHLINQYMIEIVLHN